MEVVNATLGKVCISGVIGVSSIAEAAGREAIEDDGMVRIHGNHLEGIAQHARPGLNIDECAVHRVTTGMIRNVTAQLRGQMSLVSVNDLSRLWLLPTR